MKMIGYRLGGLAFGLRAAPRERRWMSATRRRFAYRCLPLDIANAHGWEVLCPKAFTAIWNGGPKSSSIRMRSDDGSSPPATSHFGYGVLTFYLPFLFRTEPGYDLFVTGPLNSPKDGLYALSGIVETDWAPYSFTMNWIFTRRSAVVRFEQNEPVCHFFPVPRGMVERVEPEFRDFDEAPELERSYLSWLRSRISFNKELENPASEARRKEWQKHYFKGLSPDNARADLIEGHRTALRLKDFK
jgi:hypothetical protein